MRLGDRSLDIQIFMVPENADDTHDSMREMTSGTDDEKTGAALQSA